MHSRHTSLEQRQRWMREQQPTPVRDGLDSNSSGNLVAFERHYRARELAEIWSLDESTVRRLFQDEPGVLKIGVETGEAWRVLRNVALDSAPLLRRRAFELLATEATEYETAKLATKLAYPTQTTRRALEELHAHGLIQRATRGPGKADRWSVSEQWEMQYALVAQPFPKCRES